MPTTKADLIESDLLTVWRKLHIEVDSMAAPPDPSTPGADQDPQRNFIVGDVLEFSGNKITLKAAQPSQSVMLKLDDGSPNLNGAGLATLIGKGRFENGTIKIGANLIGGGGGGGGGTGTVGMDEVIALASTHVSATVTGNGIADQQAMTEYVELTQSLTIDCTVTLPGNGGSENAVIESLDPKKREFRLTKQLVKGKQDKDLVGGTISLIGLTFHITKAEGKQKIIVQEDAKLPFLLVDDDQATAPFLPLPGSNGNADPIYHLLQTSDLSGENIYASAYIKPVYDLQAGQSLNVTFRRNVMFTDFESQLNDNNNGQTYFANANFWVVYLQGAFQGPTFTLRGSKYFGDADPNSEENRGQNKMALSGLSGAVTQNSRAIGGTLFFRETNRDIAQCPPSVLAHETGHLFGLPDENAGIMQLICPVQTEDFQFTTDDLQIIRTKAFPVSR